MVSACVSALTIFCLVGFANAQVFSWGKCPNFKVKKQFDPQMYLGRWYEYSKYDTQFERGSNCITADYSDITKTGGPVTIGVLNRRNDPTKGLVNATGEATLVEPNNPDKPAKLFVTFNGVKFSVPEGRDNIGLSVMPNYNVVDTDYTSYTIVYACRMTDTNTRSEFLWILTRERNPPQALVNDVINIIRNESIDTNRLEMTAQTGCPELPSPSSSSSSSFGSTLFVVALSSVQMVLLRKHFF